MVPRRKRFRSLPAAQGGGRRRGPPLPLGGFLDGDLLSQFHQLPADEQAALAVAAGSDRATVLRHLGAMAAAVAFF